MASICELWNYMFENLFCTKTKMFYDIVVAEHRGQFENYLPSLDMIRKGIPNPCGWGTGMEDCVINGSVMLDAMLDAYQTENSDRLKAEISHVFSGLKTCASVSESEGFLARGVSPIDGKTHYMNSSRDQYTHWIFSADKYLKSGLASEEDAVFIKQKLCAFARRAQRNVTAENDWDLLREDGKQGMITRMWECMPHETMRLPMIYLAAWKIANEPKFSKEYISIRNTALSYSEEVDVTQVCAPFALSQMQLSLRFVYDNDEDEEVRKRCRSLMQRLADYAKPQILTYMENGLKPENTVELNYQEKEWRQTPAVFEGYISDQVYYLPLNSKCYRENAPKAGWLIRNIADLVMIYATCPGAEYAQPMIQVLEQVAERIDMQRHTTFAPGNLLEAYYAMQALKK